MCSSNSTGLRLQLLEIYINKDALLKALVVEHYAAYYLLIILVALAINNI